MTSAFWVVLGLGLVVIAAYGYELFTRQRPPLLVLGMLLVLGGAVAVLTAFVLSGLLPVWAAV